MSSWRFLSPHTFSLHEQRRIVAELDRLQTEADSLKTLQAETGTELRALMPSIVSRAFTGQLAGVGTLTNMDGSTVDTTVSAL